MSEPTSLDDVLSDAKPEESAPVEQAGVSTEAVPEASPEPVEKPTSAKKRHREKEQQAKDEGAAPPVEEVKPEPEETKPEPEKQVVTVQEMTDKEKAFLRAAQEERNKRQELERRLAALEKPAEPPKPFFEDPDSAMKQFEKRMEETIVNTKFMTAEAIARSKYKDFDEKLTIFGELLQQTPGLHTQWVNSADPADFAYRLATNHQQIMEVGSIDALRQKIEAQARADERAKVEAEYKAKAEEAAKQRAALPRSLSEARGSNPQQQVWNGPTSLDDILKG